MLGGVDQPRTDSIDPAALFTPRGIVDRVRELSGEDRSPIGVKSILRAARCGDLRAAFVANRFLITWSDFERWLEGPARAPIISDPTARERVERDADEVAMFERVDRRV